MQSIIIIGAILIPYKVLISPDNYVGEVKTVWHQNANNLTDSVQVDLFYLKKITEQDTIILDSLLMLIPELHREFNHYIYQGKVITVSKLYNYSRTLRDTNLSDVEKAIVFNKYFIKDNHLAFNQVMRIDSKEYPLVRNCTVIFENQKAIISGDGGRINVNLDNLTATDEKGQPVIVHYPEKKR